MSGIPHARRLKFRRLPLPCEAEIYSDKTISLGVIRHDSIGQGEWERIKKQFLPRIGGTDEAIAAIPTNNGFIAVCEGDIIIRSHGGALHAAPPKVFASQYEPASEEAEKAMMAGINQAVRSHIEEVVNRR